MYISERWANPYIARTGPALVFVIAILSMTGCKLDPASLNFTIVGQPPVSDCNLALMDTAPYARYHAHVGDTYYDINTYGIPKFILKSYIEVNKIDSISRFRSGEGHDYSDDFESCRSMKHYFVPSDTCTPGTVKIFSPVNGTVLNTVNEGSGYQVFILPNGMPAFNIIVFHVSLLNLLNVGDSLQAGQQIGYHFAGQHSSDIAVSITTLNNQWKLVSYFDAMTDIAYLCYQSHGALSRDSLIISKTARDADTLGCNAGAFVTHGTLKNWFVLQ